MDSRAFAVICQEALWNLNPIMDHISTSGRYYSVLDADGLWKTATFFRQKMIRAGIEDPWPIPHYILCSRPTNGGLCHRGRSQGKITCWQHHRACDEPIERAWQDIVHYPYIRVNVHPAPDISRYFKRPSFVSENLEGIYDELREIAENTK